MLYDAMADIRDIPLQRKWIPNSQSTSILRSSATKGGFYVLSYNILGDCYWSSPERSHPWCPAGYRSAIERLPQLMRQLEHHDAEIICLQEVDLRFYKDYLKPRLELLGYHGTHHKRNHFDEGVATFFKIKRFELLEEKLFHTHQLIMEEFHQLHEHDEASGARQALVSAVKNDTRFQRPIILSRLKCRQSEEILHLCNVHLSWTNRFHDRVLLETAMVINKLTEFAGGIDTPHILCGDFNQEVWMPGYALLHNGFVNQQDIDMMKKHASAEVYNDVQEQPVFLVDILSEKVHHKSNNLKSAYEAVMGDEPMFTNYADESILADHWPLTPEENQELPPGVVIRARGTNEQITTGRNLAINYERLSSGNVYIMTLDYLWYGSDKLHCTGVLSMDDEAVIRPFHSCPNEVFPSDHLLMKAHFQFI